MENQTDNKELLRIKTGYNQHASHFNRMPSKCGTFLHNIEISYWYSSKMGDASVQAYSFTEVAKREALAEKQGATDELQEMWQETSDRSRWSVQLL